ncbi:MAG: ComEC/Rec2 family competence protein [Gemmatimonadota bacterium]|nr:ComEC/Rec2 family competence protein [Gemmatimonadota bacterium]
MPLITWVLLCVAGGLITGYAMPWQLAAGVCGALAWLAAADLIEMPCVIYFAAACAISVSDGQHSLHRKVIAAPDGAALNERMRMRASAAIDSAFGEDAPIARALLVADQSEIPRDVKRMYADAGIVHMLAISGLHVSIVATSLALLMSLIRIPTRTASLLTAAIIIAYVFMLGFPAPALRAAVMVCVTTGARVYQRHASRWSVLALGGLVPLTVPATVTEAGYQLSMAGMAGVMAAAVLSRRFAIAAGRTWTAALVRSLMVSTVATLATAPLVAAWFGRLSLIGPLTNVFADPVIALLQPILFLSLVLSPWPAMSRFVANAAHPLLLAFQEIARRAASVPHAAIAVSLSPASTIFFAIAAAALIVACNSRLPARAAVLCAGAAAVAIFSA